MKKLFKLIATAVFAATLSLSAFACGNPQSSNKIIVGASSTPHAEILEQVKGTLKEWGYDLEIRIFEDYVLPNTALESGEIDANYFQHEPYLLNFNKENKTDLVSVEKIHYEPFGVFGKNVGKDDYISNKTGRTIIIPSDGSNCTRALFVLQGEGFITLKDGVSASSTLSDIDILNKNGNNIVLAEASTIPAQLNEAADGTIAVINGNYALEAGLSVKTALATEKSDGEAALLYANIIAVKRGNENDEKIAALISALKTAAVYDYIVNTYKGAVLPVFDRP